MKRIVLHALLMVCCVLSMSQQPFGLSAQTIVPSGRVSDAAWNATGDGAEADVIVNVAGYPDLSAARDLPTKQAKTRFVYEVLTTYVARAQASLQRELTRRGIRHTVLWLNNSIAIQGADRGLLDWLARRSDIAKVNLDGISRGVESNAHDAVGAVDRAPVVAALWNLTMVRAPETWALGYTGQGIVVADLDTGVMWDHAALKPAYRGWNGISVTHDYNWYDAVAQSSAAIDPHGHGTHTVGTMVGDDGAGNQVGVAPGAEWIGCRNMDSTGYGSVSRYISCFQFALAPTKTDGSDPDPDAAADITSNSWSCAVGKELGCDDPTALITATQALRDAGIMVVSAAGNSGSACSTVREAPGMLSQSFTIGAVDSGESVASFSSRGPSTAGNGIKPDVAAPGVNITSSITSGGYGASSGTSMATPHVAGVIALLWSALPGLRGEVDETEALLRRTAKPITTTESCGGIQAGSTPNNTYGHGLIDACAAIAEASRGKLNDTGALTTAPGEVVTVSLSLRNYTMYTRTNVVVTATIPATTTVSVLIPPGEVVGNKLTWVVPSIAPLSAVSVSVVLSATQGGWVSLSDRGVTYTDSISAQFICSLTKQAWLPIVSR